MPYTWGNNENSERFYFLGLQNHANGGWSHEIKRCLLLGRKFMTNLVKVSRSVVSDFLRPHGLYSAWNSPISPGIAFPFSRGSFQPSDWTTLQAYSLPAEPQGSPRILEWITYPFSKWSSLPRNQIRVSYIAGRFFTNWALRVKPTHHIKKQRHHFAYKGPYSHVGMWELDHKEGWAWRIDGFKMRCVGEDSWESLGLQWDKTGQS